ncbi:GreA/GreB family elongation factor [Flavobacterium sp. J27]|uniref:GreA/GreB family elongation factor n=1 Tax=Flavobacterium sp. J27 TaxID=2060419 RepID=UPI0010314B52|nr:GreA/GreB family elongation factor [Flavobacterium sp. J27]
MTLKLKIYSHYNQLIEEKINVLRSQITDLAIDAQNDAKGSAGDKHETALSMMHLEQEKLNQKVKEALEQKAILDSIDIAKKNVVVSLGSLVYTHSLTFFISQALPKIKIQEKEIIALSPQSPLGRQLIGKKVNDEVQFNTATYRILEIE